MRSSSLLGIVLDFLDEHGRTSHPADVALSRFFRKRRYLGSRDRRFVGDAVFAWLRHSIRGEARWRLWREREGLELRADGRVTRLGPLLAIAADGLFPWPLAEVIDAARTYAAAAGGGWVTALDRLASGFPEDLWPEDPIERVAVECSLPRWVVERMAGTGAASGDSPEAVRRLGLSLLEPAPVDLRVNLSSVEREVARRELESATGKEMAATPISPTGLRLESRVDLKRFLKKWPGWIEVQDEGSQLAAMAAAPQRGETVIDACAGGGGKTLAFADMVGGDATFHCCDIDASKLAELMRRAEPLELRSLTVHPISPAGELPQTLPRQAHLVLVDAPCSGLGSLRRNPDLKLRYGEEDVVEFAARQRDILGRFAPRVRQGGRLVYVTCSILPDENEQIARWFLETHPDFTSERPEIADRLPKEAVTPEGWLRLSPAATGTDAFFVARFRRGDSPV